MYVLGEYFLSVKKSFNSCKVSVLLTILLILNT